MKSGAKAKYANPPQFASVRAPQPAVSSHPQLKLNLPLLVPGLEQVDPAYAPTLTTDLKVLAFAGAGRQTGDYDLFLTRRASPAEPFSTPARIESCASRQYETFPTLSPDGLELLFLRFESRPTLYYARRDSVDAEFGQPVAWPAQNAVPDSRRVGGAQFIDAHHVQFVTRGDTAEQHRSILLTRRPDVGAAFAPPTPLEFTEAPVPQSVSSNLLRSYYGIPNGLFMTARKSVSEPLGVPARILEVPADGPVWVAPQEDVLYFCSPGFGHLIESSRRLWVLRF